MNRICVPLVLWICLPTSVGFVNTLTDEEIFGNPAASAVMSKDQAAQKPQIIGVIDRRQETSSFSPQISPAKGIQAPRLTKRPGKASYARFLSEVSPEFGINRNILGLTKVNYRQRTDRSITFVFLMSDQKDSKMNTQIHLMLPFKKYVQEQRVVQNQLPIDFSVANYGDGFASDQWNVMLPRKKPREIDACLLWSF